MEWIICFPRNIWNPLTSGNIFRVYTYFFKTLTSQGRRRNKNMTGSNLKWQVLQFSFPVLETWYWYECRWFSYDCYKKLILFFLKFSKIYFFLLRCGILLFLNGLDCGYKEIKALHIISYNVTTRKRKCWGSDSQKNITY